MSRRRSVLLCSLATAAMVFGASASSTSIASEPGAVRIDLFETIPDPMAWEAPSSDPAESYDSSAMAVFRLPLKYNDRGLRTDRPDQIALRAESSIQVPAGPRRLILRARGAARLFIDDALIAETDPITPNASGHEHVPEYKAADSRWRPVAPGEQERIVDWTSDGQPHRVVLWALIGDPKGRVRVEPGELCVAIASPGEVPRLLDADGAGGHPLTNIGWNAFASAESRRLDAIDTAHRRHAQAGEDGYWQDRHALARDLVSSPTDGVESDGNLVDQHIEARLQDAGQRPNDPISDAAFLRRLALDTTGVIPDPAFLDAFLADPCPDKRERAVDAFLNDPGWADHWVAYWQDVLAENPRILKPTLNNTGPFRWFLLDAFRDNLAFDRFATELIRMGGSTFGGGPAGFKLATQNDAPMAAKAHVIAKAFLAADLKCARCHDAPFHPYGQEDLFGLAAMLSNEPVTIPATSTVPLEEGGRVPAVSITLTAGDSVDPHWNLTDIAPESLPDAIVPADASARDRLAALVTSPRNERFAQVIVNRIWKRYMGVGLVEPVDDWDDADAEPSHPALLDALARELVRSGYDLKHVARLILTSRAYQAEVDPALSADEPAESRLFAGPARRRMSAEQVLDSLFAAAGKPFGAELLTLDPEGRRPSESFLNLGVPTRAWQFTSLSNERDRPALSLPVAQIMTDVLSTFGWRADRQDPITVRDTSASALQPAILANSIGHTRIARLSDDSAFTAMALDADAPEDLIRSVYLRVLSREPTSSELALMLDYLGETFSDRVVPGAPITPNPLHEMRSRVSWSNHLSPEATRIQNELERLARAGDPPTKRLSPTFRERLEDIVWSLCNSPEFVFIP